MANLKPFISDYSVSCSETSTGSSTIKTPIQIFFTIDFISFKADFLVNYNVLTTVNEEALIEYAKKLLKSAL